MTKLTLKLSATVVFILLPLIKLTISFPLQKTIVVQTKPNDIVEYHLGEFLRLYYTSYVLPYKSSGATPDREMQGDQPMPPNQSEQRAVDQWNAIGAAEEHQVDGGGAQDLNMEYLMKMRKRLNESGEIEERAKDNWIQLLKQNILQQVGWTNYSTVSNGDYLQSNPPDFQATNKSSIVELLRSNGQQNGNAANGLKFAGLVTEKIRSYYPQCDLPKGTDTDLWKDENILNLYYNLDVSEGNVQAANLRLYRLQNDSVTVTDVNCQEDTPGEDDKILRVSAYWYLKPLKKQKAIRKRICDSKVISEKANWIELNIKPAMANWLRGRNAGLAIIVEDQDGVILKADQYFNGPSCQIGGASTPKPIPTFILDALRQPYNPNGPTNHNSGHSFLGQDARAALAAHATLRLPSLDVKTSQVTDAQQVNAPVLPTTEDEDDCDSAEKHLGHDQHLAAVQLRHTKHHRRHQQHHQRVEEPTDPRNRMVATQIIWTNQQLMDLQMAHQRGNQNIQQGSANSNGEIDR